jgi:hypothetical protein
MKIIEQLKFKLTGHAVPVMRVSEVDQDEKGLIRTLWIVGTCKDTPNRLVNTWDNKGWEKAKDTQPITRLNEKGIPESVWIVSERGQTVNLYTRPWEGPNLEDIIGKAATVDDIAQSMDLYPSMRDKMIFMVIGIFIGLVLSPMLGAVMS